MSKQETNRQAYRDCHVLNELLVFKIDWARDLCEAAIAHAMACMAKHPQKSDCAANYNAIVDLMFVGTFEAESLTQDERTRIAIAAEAIGRHESTIVPVVLRESVKYLAGLNPDAPLAISARLLHHVRTQLIEDLSIEKLGELVILSKELATAMEGMECGTFAADVVMKSVSDISVFCHRLINPSTVESTRPCEIETEPSQPDVDNSEEKAVVKCNADQSELNRLLDDLYHWRVQPRSESERLEAMQVVGISEVDVTRNPQFLLVAMIAKRYREVCHLLSIEVTDSQSLTLSKHYLARDSKGMFGNGVPLTEYERSVALQICTRMMDRAARLSGGEITKEIDEDLQRLCRNMVHAGEHGPTGLQKIGNASGCFNAVLLVVIFVVSAACVLVT